VAGLLFSASASGELSERVLAGSFPILAPAADRCSVLFSSGLFQGGEHPSWASAVRRLSHRVVSGLVTGALVFSLVGCSLSGCSVPEASSTSAPSTTAVAEPVVHVGSGSTVSYRTSVRITVSNGSLASVQVSAVDGGTKLEGTMAGDGSAWVSEAAPKPAASYRVVATVKDAAGQLRDSTLTFKVSQVPEDRRLSFSVTPDDGTTVGIGQPIVVRFLTPVTRRKAIERVMLVDARTSTGRAVTGSWNWLSGSEVHWRPQSFWKPGTKVRLDLHIAGVQASATRYGRRDYSETFTIGASHITRVDGATHRAKVYRDGKLVHDWPSGTGKKGLETYSGTYVVLGKAPSVRMDSCSARITCDKKNPDYYDEEEHWATRITASGTFLHAASWDRQLGQANVSHGCVHLSDAAAEDFYSHAVIGDVVIVSNTGRGPQERIATRDPGLYDWNVPWSDWTAGSALA
jgi:lipoprotein-anchoring transpeptidase ErfK/SrfK